MPGRFAHPRWAPPFALPGELPRLTQGQPVNKAGGLTTILEKSLGAAAKGGTTNLVEA
jgi:altronate hydrolase